MEVKSETRQSKFRSICVFCGSSHGKKSSYQDAAIELGRELVLNDSVSSYNGGVSIWGFFNLYVVFFGFFIPECWFSYYGFLLKFCFLLLLYALLLKGGALNVFITCL